MQLQPPREPLVVLRKWPSACRVDEECTISEYRYPAPSDLHKDDVLWWIDFTEIRVNASRNIINNSVAAVLGALIAAVTTGVSAWVNFRSAKGGQFSAGVDKWDASPGANKRTPDQVTANSGYLAAWVCPADHRWQAKVATRSAANGCTACSGKRALTGVNDLATVDALLTAEWDRTPGANARTPQQVKLHSRFIAAWVCPKGHSWRAAVRDRATSRSCPACAGRLLIIGVNDLATVNPALATQWDTAPGTNDRAPQDVTANVGHRAGWVCHLGHRWRASVNSRSDGHGCPICTGRTILAGYNDLSTLVPALAAQWDATPGANELTPEQVGRHSPYRASWVCPEGHRWMASVRGRSASANCATCSRTRCAATPSRSIEGTDSALAA